MFIFRWSCDHHETQRASAWLLCWRVARLLGRQPKPLLMAVFFGTTVIANAPLYANIKTWYVTDYIHIPLMRDKTPGSDVLKILSSGNRITEIQRQKNLIQVKTEDGTVGWVKREDLRQFPPDAVRLKQEIAAVEQQRTLLEAQLATAKTELTESKAKAAQREQQSNAISQTASVAILQNLQQLFEQSQALKKSIAEMSQTMSSWEENNHNAQVISVVAIPWQRLLADFLDRPINEWHAWQWVFGATLLLLLMWLSIAVSQRLKKQPQQQPPIRHDPPVGGSAPIDLAPIDLAPIDLAPANQASTDSTIANDSTGAAPSQDSPTQHLRRF